MRVTTPTSSRPLAHSGRNDPRGPWGARGTAAAIRARGSLVAADGSCRDRLLADRAWWAEVEAAFLDAVADGTSPLVALTTDDVERMAELVRQFASFPPGAGTRAALLHASLGPGSHPVSWAQASARLIVSQMNGPFASTYAALSVSSR